MIRKHQISAGDRDFWTTFESGEYPPAEFSHRAHLRLAYIYLVDHDTDAAHQLMQNSLRTFLRRHGLDGSEYHETMTRARIMAVRHFMEMSPGCESSDAFVDGNPVMLDSRIMLTHYSSDVLFCDVARSRFVEPDLIPIPRYGDGVS